MGKGDKGIGFWLLWGCGVAVLAVVVWLGLRFWSSYSQCPSGTECSGAALRAALAMEPDKSGLEEADNRFVKFLIKPPEQRPDEVPDWLKERASDAGKGLRGLEGPQDNLDPHLAKRLAEDAAKNTGLIGLLKTAPDGGVVSTSIFGTDADDLLSSGPVKLTIAGVSVAKLQVRGSLSREIIGRILSRHLTEVKYCHQVAVKRDAKLKRGQVVAQFTIAPTGQVVVARVQRSTLRDRSLHRCLTRAVRRWLFPKPKGGGIVIVSCPFVLGSPEAAPP